MSISSRLPLPPPADHPHQQRAAMLGQLMKCAPHSSQTYAAQPRTSWTRPRHPGRRQRFPSCSDPVATARPLKS